MRLQGKSILITAAGQGIGRASALACVREGAQVIATDIDATLLESLASEAQGLATRVLDVRDGAAVAALAATLPALDGLFNCAGHVHDGSILDCDEAAWDFSVDLNVKGAYRMARAFLPGMLEKMARTGGSGSVVNMASMASSVKGFPRRFVYGTTKAAVIGMTKAIAADFARQGLRCNALCPGTVDTPSLRQRIASAADPIQAQKDFIARQPMGRLATVDDITPQLVYLLSDESRFVTGQAILVDGGVSI
ncbi:SDR family oxidoreductase [Verminephrobacter aporrectodeae subsp. tuberculatae]|uniref:SDR family oxidoreductase n=1 Tax=Verminephrobacter aporrectodeae TaxID=1110389 RepID=UPI000237537A|nr:SDR family oxidoreductase [Verminephrobacter aporrectodeae]MCW8164974.1 SDR family oxidoreductase [Verminephrobacter aporrectodeae subsp. tuberculatae]MCW8167922.1 SDR family oxidoreductase [Verminephrobacter aporrectodeae subsp. tuberculatae]